MIDFKSAALTTRPDSRFGDDFLDRRAKKYRRNLDVLSPPFDNFVFANFNLTFRLRTYL
jgi:hypothetical protein